MGLRSCTTALNQDGHYIKVGDDLDNRRTINAVIDDLQTMELFA